MKVEDVNRLLKQHRQMADMMKQMGSSKRGGPMAKMASMFGMGGGMPTPTPEQIEALQKQMGGAMPGMPKLPAAPPPGAFAQKPPALPPGLGAPQKLPGLGLPGLGGFNPFGKKK